MLNTRIMLTAVSLPIILSACGGGSDGSSGSSSATTTATTTTTQTTVSTPLITPIITNPIITQPVATTTNVTPTPSDVTTLAQPIGLQQQLIDKLNQQRTQCGLGALSTSNELNNAAKNHANYLNYVSAQNKIGYASHQETVNQYPFTDPATNPYFSGLDITKRIQTQGTIGGLATAVNYPDDLANEDLSVINFDNSPNQTADALANYALTALLASPYHLQGLMHPSATQIGLANLSLAWSSSNAGLKTYINTLEIVSGTPKGSGTLGNTSLITYPCNGVVGTGYELTSESPNPMPNRDLNVNPIGQPIYVMAPVGKVISTLTAHISTNNIDIGTPQILLQATDPNKKLLANQAFILPLNPMLPSTTYTVNYTIGYTDGTSVSNKFSFSTKAKEA